MVANGRTDDLTQDGGAGNLPLALAGIGVFQAPAGAHGGRSARRRGRIRREFHAVLPTAAVENMKTLEQIRGDSLATRTFAMQLLVDFA